jgi:hypothetical protein
MEITTSETAAVIAQYQYAYFSSSLVHPDMSAGGIINVNNAITGVRTAAASASVPFATKFGVYQCASEFPVGGLGYITDATKSGTTLTLKTRNLPDTADVSWLTAPLDIQVRGFSGSDAPLNGTYVAGDISVAGNVITISNLSTARQAVADGARSGLAVVGAKTSTVEYNFLTLIGSNIDWFMRKYGPASQTARFTTDASVFPPWMNLTTYASTNAQGKRWGQVNAEYFSTNMLDKIGSAVDGIEYIFVDLAYDNRADQANPGHTFPGGSGAANTDKYNLQNGTTWQSLVGGAIDATSIAAHRAGLSDYFQRCRNAAATRTKSKATPWIMGNHDASNGVLTGCSGIMEAVFFENVFSQDFGSMSDANRSTNIPASHGFSRYFNPTLQDATHGWIQQAAPKLMSNPGKVFLGCEFTNYNQYKAIRFAMCMAWLHPQAVTIVKADAGTRQVYAEQLVGMGRMLVAPTARASWGGFEAIYENGIVLLNDTSGALTKDLTGTSYRRIDAAALGVADDGVNSGGGAINGNLAMAAYTAIVLVNSFPGV